MTKSESSGSKPAEFDNEKSDKSDSDTAERRPTELDSSDKTDKLGEEKSQKPTIGTEGGDKQNPPTEGGTPAVTGNDNVSRSDHDDTSSGDSIEIIDVDTGQEPSSSPDTSQVVANSNEEHKGDSVKEGEASTDDILLEEKNAAEGASGEYKSCESDNEKTPDTHGEASSDFMLLTDAELKGDCGTRQSEEDKSLKFDFETFSEASNGNKDKAGSEVSKPPDNNDIQKPESKGKVSPQGAKYLVDSKKNADAGTEKKTESFQQVTPSAHEAFKSVFGSDANQAVAQSQRTSKEGKVFGDSEVASEKATTNVPGKLFILIIDL